MALAMVLPKCTNLVTLGLYGNKITDSGATTLTSVLPKCALEELLLDGNQIRSSFQIQLRRGTFKNRKGKAASVRTDYIENSDY